MNIIIKETEGLNLPKWARESYDKLKSLHDYSYLVDYGSVEKSRLVSGKYNLLYIIFNRLKLLFFRTIIKRSNSLTC